MSEEQKEAVVQQEQQQEAKAEATPSTFSQEQVQQMISEAVNNEVQGLKNKNNELLGKLKEQESHVQEERLKREGTYEEMKAHWEAKYTELEQGYNTKVSEMNTAIKQRDKNELISKLAGDFVDSEAGTFMLKNGMVDVEDGNQVYRDFAGNVVADNTEDFRKWMGSNPHMAHLLRGTKASGGNAQGGSGEAVEAGTITRQEYKNMTSQQRDAHAAKYGKFTFSD
jgi:hypothetical protein